MNHDTPHQDADGTDEPGRADANPTSALAADPATTSDGGTGASDGGTGASDGTDGVGRSIELEVEVPGTPEQVWRAIATGPGISSWYVPHAVEERAGGSVELSFGPGMDGTGRVAVWEPPHRIVLDGGDGAGGLAFEWMVEARDGTSCIVRLVNSGFGSGADWDGQYDAMRDGWLIFLTNLRLHLEHFAGESATASLPMATWPGPRDAAWRRLLADLGLPADPRPGDRVATSAADAPELGGVVAATSHDHLALVVDRPTPGTAFVAAEEVGGSISVSVWTYLYGPDGALASERDDPRWREWLEARGSASERGS
ncbi:SRPBCC family protein [Ilumatobacter sp.]|uniref:SRPBCC family protein n=1 Tax=Ilumatobacter sp. TaxID=1967498 RepID=UPI003B5280EA